MDGFQSQQRTMEIAAQVGESFKAVIQTDGFLGEGTTHEIAKTRLRVALAISLVQVMCAHSRLGRADAAIESVLTETIMSERKTEIILETVIHIGSGDPPAESQARRRRRRRRAETDAVAFFAEKTADGIVWSIGWVRHTRTLHGVTIAPLNFHVVGMPDLVAGLMSIAKKQGLDTALRSDCCLN